MEDRNKELYRLRKSGKTQEELAKIFNITYQRVQQILGYFPKVKVCFRKYVTGNCEFCKRKYSVKKIGNVENRRFCTYKCWLQYHTKNGETSKPSYKRERARKHMQLYYKTPRGNKIIKKIAQKARKKDKEKNYARSLLNQEVLKGKIKKPKKCSNCGQSKLRITGHHHDYSKPLEVVWLCDFCHHSLHSLDRKLRK